MSANNVVPRIEFNDGNSIPQLGYGLWNVPADEAQKVTTLALEAGYRHIDTAAIYENEEGVGQAFRDSGLAREDVFITTKLWNSFHGYDSTLKGFENSRKKLGLDYVDLYLIHWAMPEVDLYVETFKAFEKLKSDGLVKSIGVANFPEEQLRKLVSEVETAPAIHQFEIHPYFTQKPLRGVTQELGIVTEAYSPLGGPGAPTLEDKKLAELAEQVGKSPAQVVLRWHIQSGHVVIPKSVTPERIQKNIEVFDFELTSEQMNVIDGLNQDNRTCFDPSTFTLGWKK